MGQRRQDHRKEGCWVLRSYRTRSYCYAAMSKNGVPGGAWLAQPTEHMTVDLRVRSSSLMLDLELT